MLVRRVRTARLDVVDLVLHTMPGGLGSATALRATQPQSRLRRSLVPTAGGGPMMDEGPLYLEDDDDRCGCLAYDPVHNAHTDDQHTNCGGMAALGPPCGGCDACISAQVRYYERRRFQSTCVGKCVNAADCDCYHESAAS